MRFLSKAAFCILLVAICPTHGQSPRTPFAPPDPAKATAVVTRAKATFTIPVGQRSLWRWNVATTPVNAREYQWEVAHVGIPAFGFSLFKAPGAKPGSGNLTTLIAAGQKSIWEATPDGKGGSMVGMVRVTPVQKDSAVEIVVNEPRILKQFLTTRPASVEVVTKMPDLPDLRYSIPVKYDDR